MYLHRSLLLTVQKQTPGLHNTVNKFLNTFFCVQSENLTAVNTKTEAFRDVIPFRVGDRY